MCWEKKTAAHNYVIMLVKHLESKHIMLFRYVVKINKNYFVKKVYMNEVVEGQNVRERLQVKWIEIGTSIGGRHDRQGFSHVVREWWNRKTQTFLS